MKQEKYGDIADKPVIDGKEESISEQKKEAGQISNFTLFMKVGIIVLSIIAIIGFGIQILPNSVAVTTMTGKNVMPIYSVETEQQQIALSFDTTWGNEDIRQILDVLSVNEVKATFFVTGDWVEKYPEDVKAIVAAGHDIGNHGEHHAQMTQLTEEECIDEIMEVHDKVEELTGIEMNLFRAPYGDYDNELVSIVKACGYYPIQWNIDSLDWKDYGVNTIRKSVVDNKDLSNGSIILLHNGAKYTVDALDSIIDGLREKGYQIVPVSELIYTGDYKVDQMGRQIEQ